MMKLRYVFFLLPLALTCCKKPYNPPVSSTPNSYMVVEGVINTGNDSTVFVINKTVKLNDSTTFNPVLGATVTVEGENGTPYFLTDIYNNGHYNSISTLNLPSNQRYRLRIKTSDKEYLSDYVVAKATPPIDSVGYNVQNGNVNLYVNAHDPNNSTRFYRWDYDETWQFHAKYDSEFVLDPTTNSIVARNANQEVYQCFGSTASSHIVLYSTEKLAKDVVFQGPLTQMPLSSEKVETRYSILVRQYALTQDAFQFYQTLQKNTEQLGSIFDAQPSQLTGNIHCTTNPNEPVVGYVTASNVQQKRIFINHTDLPGDVQPLYPYDCEQDSAYYSAPKTFVNQVQNTLINPPLDYIPTLAIYDKMGHIIGYLYSSIPCTTCTLRGVTQAPSWWH